MAKAATKVLFFALIFVMMVLSSMVAPKMGMTMKVPPTAGMAIAALLSTGFLALVYFLSKMGTQADGFTFEVTGPRMCDGGPYLWDEKMAKHCSKYTEKELAGALCQGGLYNGAPTHFEYTSPSNKDWENDQCLHCSNGEANNSAHSKGDWSCGTGPHPF